MKRHKWPVFVIPANAGIQGCQSRWETPAFAGVTALEISYETIILNEENIYIQGFLVHMDFFFRLFFLFVFGFAFRKKIFKFFEVLPYDG